MNRHDRRAANASGLLNAEGKPIGSGGGAPRPIKVALVMPTTGTMQSDTAFTLAALTSFSLMHGVLVWLHHESGSMISKSRNSLVESVLPMNPDYIMWLDADMTLPPDALLRLLQHGKDIVGACYTKRVPPYNLLGKAVTPDVDFSTRTPPLGLEPMLYMPGGVMLVKASVYKVMPWPWYFETYHRYHHQSPHQPDVMEAFLQSVDDSLTIPMVPALREKLKQDVVLNAWVKEASAMETGGMTPKYVGEDFNFSKKARRHGFQLWCDLDLTLQTGHIGTQVTNPVLGQRHPAEPEKAAQSSSDDR